MKFTELFTKTLKDAPAEETAVNAQLLIRGGFVFKNSAGVYSYLPLGWRVARKIMQIVREEMDAVGGQEMFMPALVEKKYLEPTKRWDLDVGYFARGMNDKEFGFTLGWTHEEVLTAIAAKYISSYRDLPFSAYQIQTKFRHEARAKSGLLRGREFMMKDLYSFHTDENGLMEYYDRVAQAYHKVFGRCGLKAYYTLAAGGVFTISNTHEFQVLSDVGEDTILLCVKCDYAENVEISKLKEGDACPKCDGAVSSKKSIEVGNIFPLGTKYSEPLGLMFTDQTGAKKPVVMGSYGIGISRLVGTLAEVFHDDKGIIWPESVAPYRVHLVELQAKEAGDVLYWELTEKGIDVLYDDRDDKTAGAKFADADLIGCPVRLVVSKRLGADEVEVKMRGDKEARVQKLPEFLASLF